MKTVDFFALYPVFSLEEAAKALAPPGGRAGAVERLKYHLAAGHLKLVTRELYAVVPAGASPEGFQPDPFLVAVAARVDGTFSHHSALELLGAAHSTWNQCTLYTDKRRRPLKTGGMTIRFLDHPAALRGRVPVDFATRKVERQGKLLRVTGPERTLVDGFSRLDLVGGLEELVVSAGGFPTLELRILKEVLERYGVGKLWGAVGWFLEQHKRAFEVSEFYLLELEKRRPSSPQYLAIGARGGTFSARWNLIVPEALLRQGGADERQ